MNFNRRAVVLSLLTPLALAACSSMRSGPRQVDVSERRLFDVISRLFPVKKRYLECLRWSSARRACA